MTKIPQNVEVWKGHPLLREIEVGAILLMEEILHHLGCIKPCK